MEKWSPSSWRSRPVSQQPAYPDAAAVDAVSARISRFPPLVFSGEVENLKHHLAEAAAGKKFVLHGGDCAERFVDCDRNTIVKKLKILLQMSLVLMHASKKPVIRIGRMAGQYAKPRSSDYEDAGDGQQILSYRGDLVNDLEPTTAARTPDPQRLQMAYFHAATTLNFVRALVDGGFADLRHPEHWDLEFLGNTAARKSFQEVADRIRDAILLFESLGAMRGGYLETVEFFTSHEGLVLPYEEALTSRPPRRDKHYNLGAHFLWIGDRTRALDGAHIEYFRGLANPIGLKIGPSCSPSDLKKLAEVLNPDNEPGRLTLISRYGADRLEDHLPGHIRAMREEGREVLWSSDPMHGNGIKAASGIKTRDFNAILRELKKAFEIHAGEGSELGGVHFELTGDHVTECIGGAQGISEEDLTTNYNTGCDPRMNYAQSMEMAFLLGDLLRKRA